MTEKKKKIVFVHHGKGIGGAPLTLLTLLKAIDRSQFDCVVLCLFESEASDLFRREGFETRVVHGISLFPHTTGVWYNAVFLPVFFVRLGLLPLSVVRAARVLKRLRPHLVHLNSSSLVAFALAARWLHIPVVTHVLEHVHHGYFGVRRFLLSRLLLFCSSAVVCLCRSDATAFPSSHKLHVIYDSVDPAQLQASDDPQKLREALGIPANAPVVGMMGGISPIKGTLEFLFAAREVLQQKPETYFVIAGVAKPATPARTTALGRLVQGIRTQRNYRLRVEAAASDGVVKEKVRFLEARWEVGDILKMVDLLVFPSTVPHFARPLIEAGFLRKPVVASRVGGPEEIVVDGETGFLVPPRDPHALAAAVLRILNNPGLAQRFGEAGYRRASELFHARENIPKLLHLVLSFSRT